MIVANITNAVVIHSHYYPRNRVDEWMSHFFCPSLSIKSLDIYAAMAVLA